MGKYIDPEIGIRLAEIRRRRGLIQRQLATAIGVTLTSLQNYERGRNAVTDSRLYALACALRQADPPADAAGRAPSPSWDSQLSRLLPRGDLGCREVCRTTRKAQRPMRSAPISAACKAYHRLNEPSVCRKIRLG